MVGETVFGQQRTAGRQQRALYGNRLELPTPGEGVVEVVDDGCHCDAINCGHRAALREGCATAETPRTAERTHATRDATEFQKLPPVHRASLSVGSVAFRLGPSSGPTGVPAPYAHRHALGIGRRWRCCWKGRLAADRTEIHRTSHRYNLQLWILRRGCVRSPRSRGGARSRPRRASWVLVSRRCPSTSPISSGGWECAWSSAGPGAASSGRQGSFWPTTCCAQRRCWRRRREVLPSSASRPQGR